jgi:hypothetical protein
MTPPDLGQLAPECAVRASPSEPYKFGHNRRRPQFSRRLVGLLPSFVLGPLALLFAASGASAGTALAPFTSSVDPVSAVQLGGTWHAGCPIGPAALRAVHVLFYGFDRRSHPGTLVVQASVSAEVITVFRELYAARFPIRQMVPESAFGGKDPASMAADNTSGFNCRYAVATGPKQWSVHAYGEAIDVDPLENPYLFDGDPEPAAGKAYLNRGEVRPGMAVAGGTLVKAFSSVGWLWGGRWSASPDYQHFSKTGG